MSKFLKRLVQGRNIFDTQFSKDYLRGVIRDQSYMHVLRLHKNGKPEDFVFKGWTFSLVAHDISESVCKNCNIPYCESTVHNVMGFPYCRYYFLLAEHKTFGRKYLIPVDTHTFVLMDKDILSVPSDWLREQWLREELNKWAAGLCNTDADITEWRYLRGFFAWCSSQIHDIMRRDYE